MCWMQHFLFFFKFVFVCFPPVYAILANKTNFCEKGGSKKGWETDKLQFFFGKQTK
jgi:hypothetical protein